MKTQDMINQVSILTDKELSGLAAQANPGTQLHDIVSIESAFRATSFPSLLQSAEDERRARLRATEPISNTVNRETQQWITARLTAKNAREDQ